METLHFAKEKKGFPILIHCILPVSIGLFIYLFLRNSDTCIAQFFNFQNTISNNNSWVLYHIRFHLPDFLWAYSFCTMLLLLTTIKKKTFAALSFLFVSTTEISTSLFLNATFDLVDIFYMMAAIIISMLVIEKRNYEKLDNR